MDEVGTLPSSENYCDVGTDSEDWTDVSSDISPVKKGEERFGTTSVDDSEEKFRIALKKIKEFVDRSPEVPYAEYLEEKFGITNFKDFVDKPPVNTSEEDFEEPLKITSDENFEETLEIINVQELEDRSRVKNFKTEEEIGKLLGMCPFADIEGLRPPPVRSTAPPSPTAADLPDKEVVPFVNLFAADLPRDLPDIEVVDHPSADKDVVDEPPSDKEVVDHSVTEAADASADLPDDVTKLIKRHSDIREKLESVQRKIEDLKNKSNDSKVKLNGVEVSMQDIISYSL